MDYRGFADMREASKKKRGENRQSSAEILRRLGVFFETNNNGVHLVVRHGGRVADFWPGTGKYTIRGSGSYQHGVFNLLRELGVKG